MPEPGDLYGPYRLVSELGKGAMGEVWRARDERLDRYVALKVLPAELADDPERRARMLREARAAAAIRHANVVTLFDIVEHGGGDILVMELVEGRTLSDILRKDGPPTLEVALRWIEGVADALVAAHARHVLHRDIKAANIMVTSEGGVKVLDFGLAKLRDGDAAPAPAPRSPPPSASLAERIALDATMPSSPHGEPPVADLADTAAAGGPGSAASSDLEAYQTHAGSLLGTPLYMSPEQIAGDSPDERSEIFSTGVLAYEILTGKTPYAATTLEELYRQITAVEPKPLDKVPEPIAAIVRRALAKDPAERWPSMKAFHDALAAERRRLFAPRVRRWPLVAAAVLLALGGGAGLWWRHAHRPPPPRPGDEYVARALEEYDVFYNDKARSSLRAALRIAPEHPRANAYMILFGGASEADRTAAIAAGLRARSATADRSKDRALLDAALTYTERGAQAARAALVAAGAPRDRELSFWAAELDYRSGEYEAARDEYRALLAEPAKQFRGRIYDHDSAVLLYLDEPTEALRIGKMYRDAFPGEADAVGVYATTLAAAGKYDEAIAAAEDALRLNEGEDTLAGLAKVLALSGNRARAEELYMQAINRAGPARRPIRRAALAMLQWIDGNAAAARATVAPCLPPDLGAPEAGGAAGGSGAPPVVADRAGPAESDNGVRERGACLFMAGVIEPTHAEAIAHELDALAADASPVHPAYGTPSALAALVRARARFFGGACVVDPRRPDVAPAAPSGAVGAGGAGGATGGTGAHETPVDEAAYDVPVDFYAAYHVPFFATWQVCEKAALRAEHGDPGAAAALLRPVAMRTPGRSWLLAALRALDGASQAR